MSTGKRLAKRSIIGTRVCAQGEDGKFYSGVIYAVKTPGNCDGFANSAGETRYSVRFDPLPGSKRLVTAMREYKEAELIGPGFQAVTGFRLLPGQKVFLTYNGREISGEVTSHQPQIDEVIVNIIPPGFEGPLELKKRLEEVRLLESRKSARLMDQDTDFARLADMAGDRKRPSSHSIDVPTVQGMLLIPNDADGPTSPSLIHFGVEDQQHDLPMPSRKRRPSSSQEDFMDECTAALVLMSLSCSPHSPKFNGLSWGEHLSPSPSSDACSWRSSTPSPPLSEGGSTSTFWSQVTTDEGIVIDEYDELPRKKKASRIVFQCRWPGCRVITTTCAAIEGHVRKVHLGPRETTENDLELSDHEEEFYYTEVELGPQTSSPPTLSHRDMARPPHEDPEYLKQLKNGFTAGHQRAGPINIPSGSLPWSSPTTATSPSSPQKHLKLSPRTGGQIQHQSNGSQLLSLSAPNKLPGSPTRKLRGETKKCRKVYGMEHREQWCTQCKWKKACTRFGD
ncbi:zinc finger protein 704 isoform X4 [Zootermopsis nevadensis]|uniref:zinc finger protein 704 isoform X4 n=1 Tax=Zootermopsis nevadensis TaxID=136037 RepID=UPI000B8EA052|nr:zinc finger protein 704 isoform X4 [Zootermopsis nevadensis]